MPPDILVVGLFSAVESDTDHRPGDSLPVGIEPEQRDAVHACFVREERPDRAHNVIDERSAQSVPVEVHGVHATARCGEVGCRVTSNLEVMTPI